MLFLRKVQGNCGFLKFTKVHKIMEYVVGVLFLLAAVTAQNVEVTPPEAVRRVGDEVTVVCRVAYPIDSCRMTIGKVPHRLRPEIQQGDVVYAGQGLENGECGARIRSVTQEMNGKVECSFPPQTGSIEPTGFMRLIVAQPPQEARLLTPEQPSFREGDHFLAQCVVPAGRPAAKITWFLDDTPLLIGPHQPVITQEPNTDLLTIAQNLTRVLVPDDNGRSLICKAEHQALASPMTSTRQLFVEYPPKRAETMEPGLITIFGLKIGEEGRLNVTVRANPPPRAHWTVANRQLIPGEPTEYGQALEPINLGGGYYNLSLVISRVTKDAVERTYYLRASNELGREEFSLRISTMDEPAGVELDTGAIVGIVIGILVLLIAVFLVVFAKATDRWCFAGSHRGRDHAKNSGESSDTESAVGGRGERSRLAELSARVRAALPRGKDKVQASEPPAALEPEEKPLSEEKKGVVYAELALGDQPGDKPPPPSAEYAEIVYTNPPEQTRTTPERNE